MTEKAYTLKTEALHFNLDYIQYYNWGTTQEKGP